MDLNSLSVYRNLDSIIAEFSGKPKLKVSKQFDRFREVVTGVVVVLPGILQAIVGFSFEMDHNEALRIETIAIFGSDEEVTYNKPKNRQGITISC